jgi:hypothetical protein
MSRRTDRSKTPKKGHGRQRREPAREAGAPPARTGSSQVEQIDDQTGRSDREAGVGRPLQLDEGRAARPRQA